MKRFAAAAAAVVMLAAVPGYGMAATLTPSDWDGLNLRAGPGTTYAKIGALAYGDSLPVVTRDGDWVQVRAPSGSLAWVSATYSIISYEDEEAWAVVDTDVLNVREGPSLSDPILTQITEGTRVRLLKEFRDWWQVRLTDGTEGWVASAYMRRVAAEEEPTPDVTAMLTPSDWDGLNLRTGPGTTYAKIGALAYGEALPVVKRDGGWIQVRTQSGTLAWVSAEYSIIFYEDELPWAVVDTDVLNVQEGPSLSDRILTQITEGTRVRLLKEFRDWWQVRLPDGTEGWVASAYMRLAGAEEEPAPEPAPAPVDPDPQPPAGSWEVPQLPAKTGDNLPLGAKEVRVLTSEGVWSGRHKEYYYRMDTVYPGELLTYLGAAEGWVQVLTPRGQRGWVPGSAVQIREGSLLMELDPDRWTVGTAAEGSGGASDATQWLEVTPWDGLRLRAAPSLEATILDVLLQGEILQVVQRQDPWVEVITSSGQRGWVHGDYTRPISVAGTPESDLTFGDGLRATLTAAAAGVMRLEVVGQEALGMPVIQDGRLLVPANTDRAEPALIPVGTGGVRYLSFDPDGVAVGLERSSGMRVVEQAPGRVVVELHPVLEDVQVRNETDRTVYVLRLRGATDARLGASSGVVTVTLPGAVTGDVSLPAGVQVQQQAGGVVVSVPTNQAYVLKETAEGYELHLCRSGLAGKTIVLDAGHGGSDPGAQNGALGVMEKDVNLAVVLRVRDLLVDRGARVLLTRATDRLPTPDDVLAAETDQDPVHADLEYRTRIADELGADAFVSIHHNSADNSTARGTETYYTSSTLNGIQSQALAWAMQYYLTQATGQQDRGYKDYDFYVTRNTDVPAVLVELAFLSNPDEARRAMDPAFQQQEAEAIVQALEAFFAAGP